MRPLVSALTFAAAIAGVSFRRSAAGRAGVGISDYQSLSRLENPVTDAKAIAAELKKYGFEVSESYDMTRADMLDVLEQFKRSADGATVAMVYYAGHGMEIGGKNVIAPTDIEVAANRRKRGAPSNSTSCSTRSAAPRSRSCCSMPAATIPSRNARRARRDPASASAASPASAKTTFAADRLIHPLRTARGRRRRRRPLAFRRRPARPLQVESAYLYARPPRPGRPRRPDRLQRQPGSRSHHPWRLAQGLPR